MPALSSSDLIILICLLVGAFYYLRGAKSKSGSPSGGDISKVPVDDADASGGDDRDFTYVMSSQNKRVVIFFGSQTGTAEDYATRLAKEFKSNYGISSLVADMEEYDIEHLDKLTEDQLAIFVVATYGEGEPTDNAVTMYEFLKDDSSEFSQGGSDLSNLRYVVFGLGNRTYEKFCAMGTDFDNYLASRGAKRIGERGEGDDDKSMEEDYLAWKDPMFEALQAEMKYEPGSGSDASDFEVTELQEYDNDKVYLGELSSRALTNSRGVFDAKNPCASKIVNARELFQAGDRNCIHAEFDIENTGIRYQAGDHVGVWPVNPDTSVLRFLKIAGLESKADKVINVTSLDPALAKVPFPVPSTYETVLRYYLDICHVASRQSMGIWAKYAPTPEAAQFLVKLGEDRAAYNEHVAQRCLNLAQVLALAAGDDPYSAPESTTYKTWNIPFDRIISGASRLQPRFYSISSSPKVSPNAIHITAVVLKYKPETGAGPNVYGVGTNYLLNVKLRAHNESQRLQDASSREYETPQYRIEGPRNKFIDENGNYKIPIHVRRSNFRLPTSPKVPVIMIGPGTGAAPFRGFVQERVALARKAISKEGEDALKDWGSITLYYGCRKRGDDYLYEDEWQEYSKELKGVFNIRTALSREPGQPKTYVQQLIAEDKDQIAQAILQKKGYVYICGDARNMAREVEDLLKQILGEAKGGTKEKEGEAEYKLLKDRNRLLLDVWS